MLETVPRRAALALLCGALAAPAPLQAQSGNDETSSPRAVCWRGSPAARCHTYLISELGIRTASDVSGTLTAGLMANTSAARAWGVSGGVAIGADDNASVVALLRHRHWLDERKALDFGVGPVITRWYDRDEGGLARRSWEGVTGLVAYSWADLAALTLEFDTGNATPVMIGLRTGSYLGTGLVLLAIIGWSIDPW